VDEIVNGYHYNSNNKNDWTNTTFHHDHLNSVTAQTGHNGTVEETTTYDAFGSPSLTLLGTGNDLLYTGREYDRETNLYYYRARYYDPEIGRFISEDPLGFKAGVNFYAYVGNNPVNFNDPSGLEPGDVYAFEPSNFIGEAIALVDPPYSHIAYEILGGRLIEATRAGVNIVDLADALKGQNYDIYHSVNFSSDSIPGLENFAAFADGADYDFGAYTGTRDTTGCAYICSTLVDDASVFSGLGSFGVPGDYVTSPSDIIFSDGFQLIGASSLGIDPTSFNSGASGGFVLYPNKINSNITRSVYSK